MTRRGWTLGLWVITGLGVSLGVLLFAFRDAPSVIPITQTVWERLQSLRYGFTMERDVRIRMRDDVQLAANVYLPGTQHGGLPTVLLRLPYGKDRFAEARGSALVLARNGFAVVVQDVRGRYASEGEFQPWRNARADGIDTLEWIARQPWSNGRVGTLGCSALGETQLLLAAENHPRHLAAIALGAGGAMGSAQSRYSYFGLFEGGVFQLASGFGWFLANGQKQGAAPDTSAVNRLAALAELPIQGLVARHARQATDFDAFLQHPPADPWWNELGYLTDADRIRVPVLQVNNWFDQTVSDTLAIAASASASPGLAVNHPVIIAPGLHCGESDVAATGRVGDLSLDNASLPYWEWYLDWFDAALRDKPLRRGTPRPNYVFYVVGENRWLGSDVWPPRSMTPRTFHLASVRGANSRQGDGRLLDALPAIGRNEDEYVYDPENPVPSRGGPVCCTGEARFRPGPVEQADVEARDDVLVYTSRPLAAPLRIAGPLTANLAVGSTAADTDFVVRLVDVHPDGRAINVQEGALRARYRNGFGATARLRPGEVARIRVDMRAIAWYFPAGHRLRVQVTSSSFPRLERNLNTGGSNFDETAGVTARNRIMLRAAGGSWITLPVVARLADGLAEFSTGMVAANAAP